ncbi:MAG: co-chaperone DjlA [Cellvibrionales bacterium]|nr:co-chaperone DjlA [Cellvibrionales bacterium]
MGKLIGTLLGVIFSGLLGPFGWLAPLLGLWLGHQYDCQKRDKSGAGWTRTHSDSPRSAQAQQLFFTTLFRLLGHLAKADGRVSEAEIAQTEALMRQTGLDAAQRRAAIRLFQQGTHPSFDLPAQLHEFAAGCGRNPAPKITLLRYLIAMAYADGTLSPAEHRLLHQVAAALGIPTALLDQMLSMLGAQTQFRREQRAGPKARPAPNQLDLAYRALGVSHTASDREIKTAYRKLMSENHPDKLIGQGVPEQMVALATERSKEISKAYDLIRAARK